MLRKLDASRFLCGAEDKNQAASLHGASSATLTPPWALVPSWTPTGQKQKRRQTQGAERRGEAGGPRQRPAKALPSGWPWSPFLPPWAHPPHSGRTGGVLQVGQLCKRAAIWLPSCLPLYLLPQLALGSSGEMRGRKDWLPKPPTWHRVQEQNVALGAQSVIGRWKKVLGHSRRWL